MSLIEYTHKEDEYILDKVEDSVAIYKEQLVNKINKRKEYCDKLASENFADEDFTNYAIWIAKSHELCKILEMIEKDLEE